MVITHRVGPARAFFTRSPVNSQHQHIDSLTGSDIGRIRFGRRRSTHQSREVPNVRHTQHNDRLPDGIKYLISEKDSSTGEQHEQNDEESLKCDGALALSTRLPYLQTGPPCDWIGAQRL
jgi:hypothetical protein